MTCALAWVCLSADALVTMEGPAPIRSARLLTIVWAAGLLVLGAYVLRFAMGRTTHGFIAYYAAARLLVTGHAAWWLWGLTIREMIRDHYDS